MEHAINSFSISPASVDQRCMNRFDIYSLDVAVADSVDALVFIVFGRSCS